MAEFPSMPMYTDAYIADTTHLSAEEHGVYFLLLMCAWRSPDCCLPNDDKKLARMARLTPAKWRKIKPTIMEFWQENDGFLVQKKLKKIHKTVSEKVSKNRENGKRGGRPKLLENNDTGKANGSISVNPEETQQEPNQNQSKEKKKKRKTGLPENCPTLEDQKKALAYWREHGVAADLDYQIDRFRAHHTEKKTLGLDWSATWRTWYVRQREYCTASGQPKGKPFEHWCLAKPEAPPEGPSYWDWYNGCQHFINFGEWPEDLRDKLDQCPEHLMARVKGEAA